MKDISIKDVYRLHGKASTSVPEDATLEYIVALLGHEPHLQGIFMVNSNQRFVGVISRFDLLKWIQIQLYGGRGKAEIRVNELVNLLNAKKAKDIETHNTSSFSVKESDTLQKALDLMISYEKDIIPVLDNEGKIIGDLSLSELLLKALEFGIQPQSQ